MMEYCINMARQIPYVKGRSRHYSVILCKKGRIVSEAANSYTKTSPRMAKAANKAGLPDKQCLHSEALALFRDKQRKGVKLIVARVSADGKSMYSAPCPVCAILIQEHSHILSVEFSV